MRVVIVEDDLQTRRQTLSFFRRYQAKTGIDIDIEEFSDGVDLVENYRPRYDIIFLDIEMRQMNGMAAAERIRRVDQNVLLVFLTNMSSYAVQSYAVQASDYILKPLTYDVFEMKLRELVRRVDAGRVHDFVITENDGMYRFSTDRLLYVEVRNHRLIYHLDGRDIETWGSLKAAEDQLNTKGFARCNNCYLVNLRHVQRVDGNDVLVGNVRLQISRNKRKDFLRAISEYLGG